MVPNPRGWIKHAYFTMGNNKNIIFLLSFCLPYFIKDAVVTPRAMTYLFPGDQILVFSQRTHRYSGEEEFLKKIFSDQF